MEMKTRILLEWHLGIPDGEEKYQSLFDFTDERDVLVTYVEKTVQASHLDKKYNSADLYVSTEYSELEVRGKSHYGYEEQAASVKIEHFLKVGKTYFKLEETYL